MIQQSKSHIDNYYFGKLHFNQIFMIIGAAIMIGGAIIAERTGLEFAGIQENTGNTILSVP